MINLTNSYKACNIKSTQSGKTKFGIRDYEKDKPDDENWANVVALNQIELKSGDMVNLEKINSIALGRYKGDLTVMIFAIVKLAKPKQAQETTETGHVVETSPNAPIIEAAYEPVIDNSYDDFNTGPLLDISSDDLPF